MTYLTDPSYSTVVGFIAVICVAVIFIAFRTN